MTWSLSLGALDVHPSSVRTWRSTRTVVIERRVVGLPLQRECPTGDPVRDSPDRCAEICVLRADPVRVGTVVDLVVPP